MNRIIRVWALCCLLAVLWQYSSNALLRVRLPDLQSLVGGSAADGLLSLVVVGGGGAGGGGARPAAFPDGMNYTTWLEEYAGRRTATALNATGDSPMMAYFPDFCGDCMWGGAQTCQARVYHLQNKYGTPDTYNAVMNERALCRNPPLRLFWEDDGVDEVDNIFTQPRLSRGNATSSPAFGNLSIYFYTTLREDVGRGLVEKMRRSYASRNNSETNAQADIAIIDLFRTYPGRTDDPSKADIFVVPYPHASHCVSKPTGVWLARCKHIGDDYMKGGVFERLTHFQGNAERHLFLNVINQGNSNPTMRNTHLSLDIGPRYDNIDLIVPYLNNLPSFQPSAILGRGEGWWTRPRTYAVAYFFGVSNSKMRHSPRVWRSRFLAEVQQNWNETLGGLPYAIRAMNNGRKPPSRLFTHMYKDAVFCPTLPGDTPPQKRFFDVIMMGCIPVVLEFDSGDGKSWHQPGGQPIENSYPWIVGSDSVDPGDAIDYRSFVVTVPGGVENVRPTLEALLQNYTEVRRRQLVLQKVASYFSYGVGGDAHRYPDAFSKILESLRHYVDGLGG